MNNKHCISSVTQRFSDTECFSELCSWPFLSMNQLFFVLCLIFVLMNQPRGFHAHTCQGSIPSASNLTLSIQKMNQTFTSETPATQNISSPLTYAVQSLSQTSHSNTTMSELVMTKVPETIHSKIAVNL